MYVYVHVLIATIFIHHHNFVCVCVTSGRANELLIREIFVLGVRNMHALSSPTMLGLVVIGLHGHVPIDINK